MINKVDLAPYVGVDLELMRKEADDVREGRPVVAISARGGWGVDAVADVLDREVLFR